MTELRIFEPDDEVAQTELPLTPRQILPFDRSTRVFSGRVATKRLRALNRARILFENQKCPYCTRSSVEPLELDDAVISRRNHRPVPGTASIVGFHCNSCDAEWPVYETVRA